MRLLYKANVFFVTFLGSGLFPKASGTMGTLATTMVIILVAWLGLPLSVWVFPVFPMWCLVLYLLSWFSTDAYMKVTGKHDPKEVVIDETIGVCITYSIVFQFLPFLYQDTKSFLYVMLIGFILFRIFDIFKPFPVSYADKKMHSAHGVLLDDVLAGIYAGIIAVLLLTFL